MSALPTINPEQFDAEKFRDLVHFFERSAGRLLRLININAPQVVIDREIQIARNRLRDIDALLPAVAASEE